MARRPASLDLPGSLAGFRDRAGALITARGWPITAATAASNLTLWLVLLACLRGTGLSQAQVSWQASLAAFAFVRLLTVLPITPGGLGITELGLIAAPAAGAGHRDGAQVTAAVLLYRAVTYLPPIPLGAIACLVWRHAPALIHATPAGAGQAETTLSGPDPARRGRGRAKRPCRAVAALETAGYHPVARPGARKEPTGGLGKAGQQHPAGCDSQGRQAGECVVAGAKLASGTHPEIRSAQPQAATERSLRTASAIS